MLRPIFLTSIFCTMLLVCQLLVPEISEAADTPKTYSIVLSSAPGTDLKWKILAAGVNVTQLIISDYH